MKLTNSPTCKKPHPSLFTVVFRSMTKMLPPLNVKNTHYMLYSPNNAFLSPIGKCAPAVALYKGKFNYL